jgi:hypothetical protein
VIGAALVSALALASCGNRTSQQPAAAGESHITTAPAPPGAPVDAVKIVVTQPGLYRVTAEQLAAAGFLQAVDADLAQLALTVGGKPAPFAVMDEDRAAIVFYGEPRVSRYGRENIYWLRRADGSANIQSSVEPRPVQPVAAAPPSAVTTYTHTLHLEESQVYLSQTPQNTDHWLWQPIYAPDVFTASFDLAGWAGGAAALRLSLWGNTQDFHLDPDHHVVLRVNGQTVADQAWDGKGWHVITTTLPAATLQATANELAIDLPHDTGATVDVVFLDKGEISYARQLAMHNGQVIFTAPASQPVVVKGVDAPNPLLWDVTNPGAAQPLDAAARSGALQFLAETAPAAGWRRYALAESSALLAPDKVIPSVGRDLRDNVEGADYIAVAAPDFMKALQPLVDWRRSQGLRVTTVSIDDVYDTFSHGLPDPAAIRDFVRYARDTWPAPAPRFLLLVGDASYDYQGFLPNSTPNYVPTYLLTTHFVGETASDNWFVSLDEADDLPDLAVGRIPAQTAEQVATVVAKTLAYERSEAASPWLERALFVADNKQAEFQGMSDDLASDFLPAGYEVEKVYLGQTADPNSQILDSLRTGVGLVNYVGHGSMNVWAQEKIFQLSDIPRLNNASALPLMVTMTCLVGYFHHPQASSMGEELLFKPDGGVVAALVPTSETLATDQRHLAEGFYRHLFGDAASVGEAIMLAKQDLPSERAIMQDLVETFTLLGDPALSLPGKLIGASPVE